MIQRLLFIVFLFFLFLIEGTVFQWIVPDVWGANWTFIPLPSLIAVIMVSIYFGPHHGIIYGAIFGLVHDLAFGHMIGGYLFSFAVVAYFSGQFIKQFHQHNVLVVLTVLTGVMVQIIIVFGLYKLFDVTSMDLQWMFFRLLIPSALINLLFTVLLLRPLKRWLATMGAHVEQFES